MATSTIPRDPMRPVAGDRLVLPNGDAIYTGCFGNVSAGAEKIYLWVPTNLNFGNDMIELPTSNISVCTLDIRHIGGNVTVDGQAQFDATPYLETVSLWPTGQISLVFQKSGGWGVTNNTPVVGSLNLDMQF